jgi:tRNA A-37 threonylcarbamoyl transferase component Bud32
VRSYRRGGALRGILQTLYLDRDRARRELEALLALRAAGVPVVEPLAALAQRAGMFWRLHLFTRLVEDALPLPSFVAARPALRRTAVERAGQVVAAAFAAGLHHPDLHPENLIATVAGGDLAVFLLDLDRAHVRAPVAAAARVAMLTRLARYLVRHATTLPVPASRTDALRFLRGMGYERAARAEVVGAVEQRLRRQLALRRLLGA